MPTVSPVAPLVYIRTRKAIRPTSGLLVTYAPPYVTNALVPDNGLAALAGVLQQAGHRVQILDYCTTATMRRLVPDVYREPLGNIWQSVQARLSRSEAPRKIDLLHLLWLNYQLERIQKREAQRVAGEIGDLVKEREVDWVGFKLWNGPGLTLPAAIARELKKRHPGLAIFGGGPQVDYFMENIFQAAPALDLLVFGDGEESLLRHAERVGGSGEGLDTIPNTIFRQGGETRKTAFRRAVELDQFPRPLYDPEVYPAMRGDSKIHFPVVEESRGCDNFCKFCGHSVKSGGQIYSKSPARVVDEMEGLSRVFGAAHFRFGGSSTPGNLLRDIAREIRQRGLKIRFTAFARVVDALTESYPLLKEAGYWGQFFGIESGDQRTLDSMKKGYRVEEAERVVNASMAAGFYTVLSFIYPAPGESAESRGNTLDFIGRTQPSTAIVNAPIVVPRTPWALEARKFGIKLNPDYLPRLMTYPIRYLLPPVLWPKAPWEIDGKSSRRLFAETGQMAKAVEGLGIATGISDDLALMAAAIGMEPLRFRDLTRKHFFTGNADELDKLVAKINQARV